MLKLSFIKSPFVLRSTHNEALQALEDASRENRKAILSMFSTAQKYRHELLLAEKKRLEDLAHLMEIHVGSSCEIGGLNLRYKK